MNDTQRQQIERLRAEGLSYGKISEALGLSINTIKTYCRRHGLLFRPLQKQMVESESR